VIPVFLPFSTSGLHHLLQAAAVLFLRVPLLPSSPSSTTPSSSCLVFVPNQPCFRSSPKDCFRTLLPLFSALATLVIHLSFFEPLAATPSLSPSPLLRMSVLISSLSVITMLLLLHHLRNERDKGQYKHMQDGTGLKSLKVDALGRPPTVLVPVKVSLAQSPTERLAREHLCVYACPSDGEVGNEDVCPVGRGEEGREAIER
jgi:hypothetical protein